MKKIQLYAFQKKIQTKEYRKNENKRMKKNKPDKNQNKATFFILVRENGGTLGQNSLLEIMTVII